MMMNDAMMMMMMMASCIAQSWQAMLQSFSIWAWWWCIDAHSTNNALRDGVICSANCGFRCDLSHCSWIQIKNSFWSIMENQNTCCPQYMVTFSRFSSIHVYISPFFFNTCLHFPFFSSMHVYIFPFFLQFMFIFSLFLLNKCLYFHLF